MEFGSLCKSLLLRQGNLVEGSIFRYLCRLGVLMFGSDIFGVYVIITHKICYINKLLICDENSIWFPIFLKWNRYKNIFQFIDARIEANYLVGILQYTFIMNEWICGWLNETIAVTQVPAMIYFFICCLNCSHWICIREGTGSSDMRWPWQEPNVNRSSCHTLSLLPLGVPINPWYILFCLDYTRNLPSH